MSFVALPTEYHVLASEFYQIRIPFASEFNANKARSFFCFCCFFSTLIKTHDKMISCLSGPLAVWLAFFPLLRQLNSCVCVHECRHRWNHFCKRVKTKTGKMAFNFKWKKKSNDGVWVRITGVNLIRHLTGELKWYTQSVDKKWGATEK